MSILQSTEAINVSEHDQVFNVKRVSPFKLGADGALYRDQIGDIPVQTLVDDKTTAGIIYVGIGACGQATSASAWQVQKIDTTGSPTDVVVQYANAGNFDQIYDNRGSLSYS